MTQISKSLTCLYCDRIFNSTATASRHRKKCKIEKEEQKSITAENNQEQEETVLRKQMIERIEALEQVVMEQKQHISKIDTLEKMFMEQKKENDFLKNMIVELMKKPISIDKPQMQEEPVKKFSTIEYLNEECKNALTIEAFTQKYKKSIETLDIQEISTCPDSLYKFVIDKAMKDINRDDLPIRCSSKRLKTFWLKHKNGEWVKGVDIVEIYKQNLCNPLWDAINEYKKRNTGWIEKERICDKMNEFNMNFCKAHYNEDYQKKAVLYLISKTLIDKSK